MRNLISCTTLLLAALTALPAAADEDVRRLELGVGAAALTRPDYRGSAEVSTTVLPVPYVSYKGKLLELSRDGLVARLFNSENLRLGVSGSGSLPGDDSQDSVRKGMPELLPTFEIGPSLEWRFSEAGGKWELRVPLRAVAAADFDEFEGIGWLAFPHLRFERGWTPSNWEVDTAVGIGPVWASGKYHRYFYQVEPQFATPERPAYDLGSGYSGARATAFLGVRRGAWRIGLGITHDALAGSVMRDSPLVETGHSSVIALGVFYTLGTWEWTVP